MSWFLPVAADDATRDRVAQDWLCKCSKKQKVFLLNFFLLRKLANNLSAYAIKCLTAPYLVGVARHSWIMLKQRKTVDYKSNDAELNA